MILMMNSTKRGSVKTVRAIKGRIIRLKMIIKDAEMIKNTLPESKGMERHNIDRAIWNCKDEIKNLEWVLD